MTLSLATEQVSSAEGEGGERCLQIGIKVGLLEAVTCGILTDELADDRFVLGSSKPNQYYSPVHL